jgi:tetrahydromethanopterin S-methyltransferase subunit B
MGKLKNPVDNPLNRGLGTDNSKPQRVEVVAKEGCFLQTLNFGCFVLGITLLAILIIVLFGLASI